MNKYGILIALLCLLGFSCTDNSDEPDDGNGLNWSLSRGDAGLSGYTSRALPKKPILLWRFKSEVRTVSSPIVYQGTTYWCDRRGLVRGVDADGNLAFSYDLKTQVEATPMIHDSVLYIGRLDGWLSAISLAQQDTLWSFETEGQISASPNRVSFEGQQAIVVGSYDNYLYCIGEKSGQLINRFESGYYLNGSVALWKKHVLFGGCDAWLRIINCQSGLPTDSVELEAYVPASPAVMGDYVYVGDYAGNVYEFSLDKGKITHTRKIQEGSEASASFVSVPAITDKTLFILSADRYLYAFNRLDGSLRWKYLMKGNTGESSPLVCGDKVLVCTKSGLISIIDAEEGELLWEYDAGEQIIGSPAIIKGCFFILTAKGTLLCFGEQGNAG